MELWELLVHIEFVSFLYCYYINTMLDHSLTPSSFTTPPSSKIFSTNPNPHLLVQSHNGNTRTMCEHPLPQPSTLFQNSLRTTSSRYLLVRSQKRKQKNVCNLFQVDNKDIRTTLMMSFWCFHCWLWSRKCWLGLQYCMKC